MNRPGLSLDTGADDPSCPWLMPLCSKRRGACRLAGRSEGSREHRHLRHWRHGFRIRPSPDGLGVTLPVTLVRHRGGDRHQGGRCNPLRNMPLRYCVTLVTLVTLGSATPPRLVDWRVTQTPSDGSWCRTHDAYRPNTVFSAFRSSRSGSQSPIHSFLDSISSHISGSLLLSFARSPSLIPNASQHSS